MNMKHKLNKNIECTLTRMPCELSYVRGYARTKYVESTNANCPLRMRCNKTERKMKKKKNADKQKRKPWMEYDDAVDYGTDPCIEWNERNGKLCIRFCMWRLSMFVCALRVVECNELDKLL